MFIKETLYYIKALYGTLMVNIKQYINTKSKG